MVGDQLDAGDAFAHLVHRAGERNALLLRQRADEAPEFTVPVAESAMP